jgi:hypothetical protein
MLPVHSLQLSSDADLLKCLRSDEQRDSKLIFARSVNYHKKIMSFYAGHHEKITIGNSVTGKKIILGYSLKIYYF